MHEHDLVAEQQQARVVHPQRDRARDERERGVADHAWLSCLPPKNFLMPAPSAARPTSTSFHIFSRKIPIAAKKPFFAATAAAPPVTSAARPYSATLSPSRNSA